MKRSWFILISLLILQLAQAPAFAGGTRGTKPKEVTATDLPKEGQAVLLTIKQGGPFPYKQDGTVFGNFERRLPEKSRGYYREYTVPTPGLRNRGARRIIAGRGGEYYYTADHYNTFQRIRE
jgi:ribonuclease T1